MCCRRETRIPGLSVRHSHLDLDDWSCGEPRLRGKSQHMAEPQSFCSSDIRRRDRLAGGPRNERNEQLFERRQ